MITLQNPHLDGSAFFLPGDRRGILLIHGLTATAAEVRPLAGWLNAQGYTVAAPLLPGHYTHPSDLNRVRWQDWARAVEEMFARLKQDCSLVIAGGESTGALLALHLALSHPEIAALLLYAPALKLNFQPLDKIKLRLMAPLKAWMPKENTDESMPWQGYRVNPLKGVLQLIALQNEVRPRLAQVKQPTLIVHGRLDRTVAPEVPEILQGALGADIVELHWMEKSTHCVILDQEAEEVNLITQKFIARILNETITA